jgi:hypothetical protein
MNFSSANGMYFALYYIPGLSLPHRQEKYIHTWNIMLCSLTVACSIAAAFTRTTSFAIWSVGTVQHTNEKMIVSWNLEAFNWCKLNTLLRKRADPINSNVYIAYNKLDNAHRKAAYLFLRH